MTCTKKLEGTPAPGSEKQSILDQVYQITLSHTAKNAFAAFASQFLAPGRALGSRFCTV